MLAICPKELLTFLTISPHFYPIGVREGLMRISIWFRLQWIRFKRLLQVSLSSSEAVEMPIRANLRLQLLSSGILTHRAPVMPSYSHANGRRGFHYVLLLGVLWGENGLPEKKGGTNWGVRAPMSQGKVYTQSTLGFDGDGLLTNDLGWRPEDAALDEGYAFAIHPSGYIVSVGRVHNGRNNDFAVVRYRPDGAIDRTYGISGRVVTDFADLDDNAFAIALYPDGTAVVAGTSCSLFPGPCWVSMARYNPNGSQDLSFGTGGRVRTAIGGVLPTLFPALSVDNEGLITITGYRCPDANHCYHSAAHYSNQGKLIKPVQKTLVAATMLRPVVPIRRAPTLAGPFMKSLPQK